jgi:hypothetical protein
MLICGFQILHGINSRTLRRKRGIALDLDQAKSRTILKTYQDAEKPVFAQAAQKGSDARRHAKDGVPTEGGSRRTPGTPQ